jgi:hypothetical protein
LNELIADVTLQREQRQPDARQVGWRLHGPSKTAPSHGHGRLEGESDFGRSDPLIVTSADAQSTGVLVARSCDITV